MHFAARHVLRSSRVARDPVFGGWMGCSRNPAQRLKGASPFWRAGSTAAACTMPQGPHTAVLDQRLVTDADNSDLQNFIARQVQAAPATRSTLTTHMLRCSGHCCETIMARSQPMSVSDPAPDLLAAQAAAGTEVCTGSVLKLSSGNDDHLA